MTKKQNDKLAKGQRTLAGFVQKISAVEEKENQNDAMGLSSNLRKSSIQRCKAAASNNKTKNPQKTIEGGEAEPQCDDGTKLVNIRKRKERRPTLLMMSLVLLTVTIRSPMEAAFL